MKRPGRWKLLRGLPVAMGNWDAPGAVPVLAAALHREEPPIRGRARRSPCMLAPPHEPVAPRARAPARGAVS